MTKPTGDHIAPTFSDWEKLRAISDDEIEALALADEDNPPTDEAYWTGALVTSPLMLAHLSHLDANVVDWFRSGGKDYWERMNDVLRDHMETHLKRG